MRLCECANVVDFAENYSFVVQDEIQSFHWSKSHCTLHPVVVYYKENGKLAQKSFCFISEYLEHDTEFVYEVQRELVKLLNKTIPTITKFEYFSDGCAAQYKNFKNMLNLCRHKIDFGIEATWTFFATSHGQSPCDGIGGTVKRQNARASLQRPHSEQMLDVSSMLSLCKSIISGITFIHILKERMEEVRAQLKERFASGHTIPGTREYHIFTPVSTTVIAFKRCAEDESFAGSYNITGELEIKDVTIESIRLSEYVACTYDEKCWIGVIDEVSEVEQDVKINFLHPSGPSPCFQWPRRLDVCWVPITDIICQIQAPVTAIGRIYKISEEDCRKINTKFLTRYNR